METDGRNGVGSMEVFWGVRIICVCIREREGEDDRWRKQPRDLCVCITIYKCNSLCVYLCECGYELQSFNKRHWVGKLHINLCESKADWLGGSKNTERQSRQNAKCGSACPWPTFHCCVGIHSTCMTTNYSKYKERRGSPGLLGYGKIRQLIDFAAKSEKS